MTLTPRSADDQLTTLATSSAQDRSRTAWRQRFARLLTWKRARNYAFILVLLYVVAWVDVVALGSPPLNSAGVPIAGDFIAFQAAGRLVMSGQASRLYDHAAVSTVQDGLLEGRIPNFYDAYRNPPFYALVYTPLASLELMPAAAVWGVIGLLCLALALYLLLSETPGLRPRWRGLLILVFAFAPVYFGLIDGENALVSLLLFALIYRSFARGSDVGLGVWSALGLFKPQLFFVFPLILLATRRWKALAWYAATAVALFAVSLALVGPDGMQAWIRILLEPEGGNATANGWRMSSAKAFFDSLLPGFAPLSLTLYAASVAVLLFGLVRVWTRPAVPLPSAFVFTGLVAVLVDPHLVDYDLSVLVAAGVVGVALVPRLAWVILPLYFVSLLRAQIPLGDIANLQLTAPLLLVCAVFTYRRALAPRTAPGAAVVGVSEQLVGAHT
jgi:hypothetical protein